MGESLRKRMGRKVIQVVRILISRKNTTASSWQRSGASKKAIKLASISYNPASISIHGQNNNCSRTHVSESPGATYVYVRCVQNGTFQWLRSWRDKPWDLRLAHIMIDHFSSHCCPSHHEKSVPPSSSIRHRRPTGPKSGKNVKDENDHIGMRFASLSESIVIMTGYLLELCFVYATFRSWR